MDKWAGHAPAPMKPRRRGEDGVLSQMGCLATYIEEYATCVSLSALEGGFHPTTVYQAVVGGVVSVNGAGLLGRPSSGQSQAWPCDCVTYVPAWL
jgi:hypothetical protein